MTQPDDPDGGGLRRPGAADTATAATWTQPVAQQAVLRFGDCELNRRTQELWRGGQKLSVRRQVFEVLLLLIDHRPQLLGHAQIARAVWGRTDLPHTRIARAVMEARRLIGDDPEAPTHIVSVRGVGYRFASDLETLAHRVAPSATAEELSGVRAAIAQAEEALQCGRYPDAHYHVDRAIALADNIGACCEMAHALALASAVVLRNGTFERAAALAAQALRYAELDGRGAVIAQARLASAEVHLLSGDVHAALQHLEEAYRWLQAHEAPAEMLRCESLFCRAYGELDDHDAAWQWCERARTSSLRLAPQARALRERLTAVMLLILQGDHAALHGQAALADDCRVRALAALDTIEPDAQAVGAEVWCYTCVSYRGHLLESLERTDEAWHAWGQLRDLIARHGSERPVWLAERERELLTLRALLLSRSGRTDEALETIEEALAMASTHRPGSYEVVEVHAMAATICERAGRYEQALSWRRRQHQLQLAHRSARAKSAASILRAELESDHVAQELAQARVRLDQLQLENQTLKDRLALMERYPVEDDTGLIDMTVQSATLSARMDAARERELPFCVGLLDWINHAQACSSLAPEAYARLLRSVALEVKAAQAQPAAVAEWRSGCFVFPIDNLGPGRARAHCEALADRLNRSPWPATTTDLQPRFRCAAVDAAQHPTLEAALTAVATAATAATRRANA